MNHRTNAVWFFLLIILASVIALQILSMVRSDRFYVALNKIEDVIEEGVNPQDKPGGLHAVEEYPGEDGDWLIWAFRVEPKTLNQINVDSDIYSRWITELNIFEPLMAYDFDAMKLKPYLADSYEISDDGLEIMFHLLNMV